MKSVSINKAYKDVLKAVEHYGVEHLNKRTGVGVKVHPGGVSFKLDLSNGIVPIPGNRRYYPTLAAAETAWQLTGTQDASFIMQRAPNMWRDFLTPEGKVEAAYGYRMRKHFSRDQIKLAILALSADKTNRQVYLSLWDGARDGLGDANQPANIPCPVGFSLSIVSNRLQCSVFIRSSDIVVGLPYDIMNFAMLMQAIACELSHTQFGTDIAAGFLHVTLAHAHYYETHKEVVEKSLSSTWRTDIRPKLINASVNTIERYPDAYIQQMKTRNMQFRRHTYVPKVGAVV